MWEMAAGVTKSFPANFDAASRPRLISVRSDDTVTSGKWALRGAKACILYSGDKEETCYNIEVFGDVATFTDEDGDGTRYTILKGNPKGL